MPVVQMQMPKIESWNCTFDYAYKIIGIKFGGTARIEVKNVEGHLGMTMQATNDGKIYPQIHNFGFDLGQTEIYMESKFKQFFIR